MMENHKFLYFQLAFLQTFTLPLSQIRIQDNTTMEFQQNINFNSITDEIWEFLVWYEIFSYECPCLARDWPEIRNSVHSTFVSNCQQLREGQGVQKRFGAQHYLGGKK